MIKSYSIPEELFADIEKALLYLALVKFDASEEDYAEKYGTLLERWHSEVKEGG